MCPRSTPCGPMRPHTAPLYPDIHPMRPHAALCAMCGPMRPHAHAPGVSARTPGARSNSENGALRHGHHGLSPNHRSIRSQGVKAPAAARCTGCTRLAARCTSSRRQAPGARRPRAARRAPRPEAGGTQVAGRGAKAGKPAARCFWPAVVRPLWPGSRPALLLLVLLLVGIWDLGSLVIWFWVSIALLAASAQGTTCPLTQPR
jgi:hypothetical protein